MILMLKYSKVDDAFVKKSFFQLQFKLILICVPIVPTIVHSSPAIKFSDALIRRSD